MTDVASVPSASGARPRHDPYAPLRIASFRWYILGLFALTLGAQMQTVVVGWQMYAATHDPLALGLVGLAEALPYVSLALFAGHTADRRDRRRITVVALAALALASSGLLTLTLRAPGGVPARVGPVYALVAASGIARSFLTPARQAMSADLVPREIWPSAIAWRGSTWQLAAVIGPAGGGLVYGFAGAPAAYGAVVALLVLALACMLALHYRPHAVEAAAATSVLESLAGGVRFVLGQRVLLGALTLDLFAVLFGGATALLPIFASEILHVGPQGLGLLQAAPAVGAVAMSVVIAHRPPIQRMGRALVVGVSLFGLCMVGFALSRSVALSLALLVASGMADTVSVVVRSTLLQTLTPVELLGRVSSVNQIFVGSSNEIGAFESGVSAKVLGAVGSVVFGGLMTLAVVWTIAWRVPQLRRVRPAA